MDDNKNTGDYNTGNWNTGSYNTGGCNTGNYNTGNYNSGSYNTGHRNTGYCNTGYCNTGDYNTGNYNTGSYNTGDHQNGHFNTVDPDKIMMFNKWVDADSVQIPTIDLPVGEWTDSGLVTRSYHEAWAKWWEDNPDRREEVTSLPGFDPEVFREITGIDVTLPEIVEINGKKYRRSDVEQRLAELEPVEG